MKKQDTYYEKVSTICKNWLYSGESNWRTPLLEHLSNIGKDLTLRELFDTITQRVDAYDIGLADSISVLRWLAIEKGISLDTSKRLNNQGEEVMEKIYKLLK